jgi:hypothetical protein
MADAQKMKKLIEDCQREIAAFLPPESGITEHQLLQRLMTRLDGCQARDALGDDWQGWWGDEDGGGDATAPQDLEGECRRRPDMNRAIVLSAGAGSRATI